MMSMIARRAFVLGLLAVALLAGCSRSTLYTFDVGILPMLDAEQRENTRWVETLHLPDEDGLSATEIGLPDGAWEGLESFTAHLELEFELREGLAEEHVTVSLHVSGSDGDPFAAAPVAARTATLPLGETTTATAELTIDEASDVATLETLRSGDVRIGLRLTHDDGTDASVVHYELQALSLAASTRIEAF